MNKNKFKIIIIGAGPNGINAYYKLKKTFPNWEIICLEKGHSLNNLRNYPDVLWHSDIKQLVLPSKLNNHIKESHQPTSSELVEYYSFFIKEHKILINEFNDVFSTIKTKDGFLIKAHNNGKEIIYESDYVILSTGFFENKNILENIQINETCTYELKTDYSGKQLALVGGGNSAADFIIHNLKKNKIFWIIKKQTWDSIYFNIDYKFKKIVEQYKHNLVLYNNTKIQKFDTNTIILTDDSKIENIDFTTILIGYKPYSDLLKKWGIKFINNCIVKNENNETNIENLFCIGSVASNWNTIHNRLDQTFVNNGNVDQINKVIHAILEKESASIFNFKRPSYNDLYPKKTTIEKIKNKIKKYVSKM